LASYRYVFVTIRSETIIEEINCFGVYFSRQLGDQGQFTASFQLDQSGKKNVDLIAATTPGYCYVVVERNDVPVWWGIVWSRTYQSQAKECQISALGFECYPQKQRMFSYYTDTGTNVELFCRLWTDMQNSTVGRNLNINVPTLVAGPTKTIEVFTTDHKRYADVMSDLSDAADGFDWTVDCQRQNNGTYLKTLRVGYPSMGVQPDSPDLVTFEYPGCITNYYMTESMSDAGTNVRVLGSGEGSSMPITDVQQSDMLNLEGWPRWDVDLSYKDVSDAGLINQLAIQAAINNKPPMMTAKIVVKADQDPVFGSYNIGDACQLVITDSRNPSSGSSVAGIAIPSVIIGYEVHPMSSDGVEEVSIILPGDTING
jgi:hypothetical protein